MHTNLLKSIFPPKPLKSKFTAARRAQFSKVRKRMLANFGRPTLPLLPEGNSVPPSPSPLIFSLMQYSLRLPLQESKKIKHVFMLKNLPRHPKFYSFLWICKFGDVSIVLYPAPFSKLPRRGEKLSLYRNTFNLAASWVQSIRKVLWMNILNKDTCNSIVRFGFEINHIHLHNYKCLFCSPGLQLWKPVVIGPTDSVCFNWGSKQPNQDTDQCYPLRMSK